MGQKLKLEMEANDALRTCANLIETDTNYKRDPFLMGCANMMRNVAEQIDAIEQRERERVATANALNPK